MGGGSVAELRPKNSASMLLGVDRWAGAELILNLANSPMLWSIWQRSHNPRPPQTVSRSTPSCWAASSTDFPVLIWPRLPEGVNTISTVVGGEVGVMSARG